MIGGYLFVAVFLILLPFGIFTTAPLDDLTINLNMNEGGPNIASDGIQNEEEENDNLSNDGNDRSTLSYAFKGYDIMFGSPIDPNFNLDPGFRQPIFDIKYKDNEPDVPIGTSIIPCTNCDFEVTTKLVSGMNSYLDSLKSVVNFGATGQFDFFTAKFSGGLNYEKMEKETSENENFVTHSHVTCCSYGIEIDMIGNNLPPFTKSFLDQVSYLGEGNDFQTNLTYIDLIDAFGTHFLTEVTFGSMFGEQAIISKDGWLSLASEGIDITAAASASALVDIISMDSSTDIRSNHSKKFDQHATDQKKYTKGSYIDYNMNISTWLKETKENPEPIYFRLEPIVKLFVDKKHGLNVTKTVKEKVVQVYKDYCKRLVKKCKQPGPDRGFPFVRKWNKWFTGITAGGSRKAKKCDDFKHITWMQFIYVDKELKTWDGDNHGHFHFPQKHTPIITNLIFGCSNGKNYSMTDTKLDGEIKASNITCNNNNGFMKMQVQLSDSGALFVFKDKQKYKPTKPILINAGLQCFDDSKPQYVIFPRFDCIFKQYDEVHKHWYNAYICEWSSWIENDKENERMVGIEIQEGRVKQGEHDFPMIYDLRFESAIFN